jgi:hypothetical protein
MGSQCDEMRSKESRQVYRSKFDHGGRDRRWWHHAAAKRLEGDAVSLTLGRFVEPVWPDRAIGGTAGPDPGVADAERGWRPTPGEIDRTGTFGGGPGSEPGERRCTRRPGPAACMTQEWTNGQTMYV